MVYDLEGKQLLSGKTDAQGEFSFKVLGKTGLKIVIQAGMGHRGEWTIPAGDIAPLEPKSEPAVSQETPSITSKPQIEASSVNLDQMREVIEQSLDRRLGPVFKMFAESQDKAPTLHDILGGIGYIFGLLGLAAYIHFRRETREMNARKKG